jgi:hypothetical protein
MKILITEKQYRKIFSEDLGGGDEKNFPFPTATQTTPSTTPASKTPTPTPKKVSSDGNCSTETIKPKDWKDLYGKLVQSKMINSNEPLLIVWGPRQTLYYTTDGKGLQQTFKISTGANGFGNSEDDKKTPTGLIKVSKKIVGKDFEVMVGKQGTGTILGPTQDSGRIDIKTGNPHIAEVLTGILELTGLESCNSNVKSRNIYFHGTNREQFLGQARSNGCIRVSNEGIKWLLNNVNVGTKVYIKP